MGFLDGIKHIAGGVAQVATGGAYNPNTGQIGLPNPGALIDGPRNVFGGVTDLINGIGGGGKPPGAPGGGGDASAAMADALRHQADQQLAGANVAANASRDVANAELAGAQANANASIKASQNAAAAGIIGSAMGAHTTHEEIKQWLPSEVGAATMQSWDLAEKWNTTRTMREQGYSNTAIEYALQGKSGKALFSDPQWNAMKMVDMTKKDVMASVQQFGIQSEKNPYGIQISENDWMDMHAYKDPQSMLEVDPAVKAQRMKVMADWEQQMRASGNGLLVDIYKNPQLGGSSILTMKGKEPLIDPALAGVLGQMAGTDSGIDLSSLTQQGKGGPQATQIQALMDKGIVDKYGMINAGELMKNIPPELTASPEYNFQKQLSPEESLRLKDQYNQFASMQVDPKNIREENMGFGVTKKIKLNADGSIAATAMQGTMTDAMGNDHFVSMSGTRLQEWYDRMSMIGGKGPTFPGMRAPVTQDQRSGRMETGFWHDNVNATPNNGVAGFNGGAVGAPGPMPTARPATANPYQGAQVASSKPTPSAPMPMQGASLGKSGGSMVEASNAPLNVPPGFTGAPLKAGG